MRSARRAGSIRATLPTACLRGGARLPAASLAKGRRRARRSSTLADRVVGVAAQVRRARDRQRSRRYRAAGGARRARRAGRSRCRLDARDRRARCDRRRCRRTIAQQIDAALGSTADLHRRRADLRDAHQRHRLRGARPRPGHATRRGVGSRWSRSAASRSNVPPRHRGGRLGSRRHLRPARDGDVEARVHAFVTALPARPFNV